MIHHSHVDSSRRIIDMAVGVLVGLRGCSDREAFDELVRVVHRSGTGLGTVASGLVALAAGSPRADHGTAYDVWGQLLSDRYLFTPVSS
jgi:hypothetical protein